MIAPRGGVWVFLMTITMFLATGSALALPISSRSPTTQSTTSASQGADTPPAEHVRAGNPIMGVVIVIGVVAFLIFVAWIFSRISEGHGRTSDNSMN